MEIWYILPKWDWIDLQRKFMFLQMQTSSSLWISIHSRFLNILLWYFAEIEYFYEKWTFLHQFLGSTDIEYSWALNGSTRLPSDLCFGLGLSKCAEIDEIKKLLCRIDISLSCLADLKVTGAVWGATTSLPRTVLSRNNWSALLFLGRPEWPRTHWESTLQEGAHSPSRTHHKMGWSFNSSHIRATKAEGLSKLTKNLQQDCLSARAHWAKIGPDADNFSKNSEF